MKIFLDSSDPILVSEKDQTEGFQDFTGMFLGTRMPEPTHCEVLLKRTGADPLKLRRVHEK